MFILYLFIHLVLSQEPHTDQYNKFQSCELDKLFIQNTYGGLFNNPCQQMNSEKFKKMLVDNNISCDASWCFKKDNYGCQLVGNKLCPNTEHIIDLNQAGQEYNNCDKNILGNMVIAYGQWNYEVGTKNPFRGNWENIKREKTEVYKDIFNMADFYVRNCNCDGNINNLEPTKIYHTIDTKLCNDEYNNDTDYNKNSKDDMYDNDGDIIILLILFFCVICILTIVGIKKSFQNKNSQDDEENPDNVELDEIKYSRFIENDEEL